MPAEGMTDRLWLAGQDELSRLFHNPSLLLQLFQMGLHIALCPCPQALFQVFRVDGSRNGLHICNAAFQRVENLSLAVLAVVNVFPHEVFAPWRRHDGPVPRANGIVLETRQRMERFHIGGEIANCG